MGRLQCRIACTERLNSHGCLMVSTSCPARQLAHLPCMGCSGDAVCASVTVGSHRALPSIVQHSLQALHRSCPEIDGQQRAHPALPHETIAAGSMELRLQ